MVQSCVTWYLRMRFLEAELEMGVLVKGVYWRRALGRKRGAQHPQEKLSKETVSPGVWHQPEPLGSSGIWKALGVGPPCEVSLSLAGAAGEDHMLLAEDNLRVVGAAVSPLTASAHSGLGWGNPAGTHPPYGTWTVLSTP